MDGVVVINKPRGMTSHDVVLAARRILKEKRIGHTGTLDPLATGVLVLCVGRATRIAQYLEAGEKEYEAVMRLGIVTDTLDAQGSVLATREFDAPARERLKEVMRGFVGQIMQQPPAYSALKVSGVPSYKLAREGNAGPLAPRLVHIQGITLTSYASPFVGFTVVCSKGVYIRSVCADMGETLGMGAHLTELKRTRSGTFTLEGATSLDQLVELHASGRVREVLMSMNSALADFPAMQLSESEISRVSHGNQISCPAELASTTSGLVRLIDGDGTLLAIARSESGVLKPERVFS